MIRLRFLAVLSLLGVVCLGYYPAVADTTPVAGFLATDATPSTSKPISVVGVATVAAFKYTLPAASGDRCIPSPGREVITREEIAHAGIARLSDVFRLSDRWYAYTVDGYTWHAQASGLAPASNPRWALIIDDIPVELGLFGIKNLDSAPIHVNEIACIVMTARPSVVAGALRQSGTIHIKTSHPDTGAAVDVGVSAGNEINDPGPFAYTPLASPNVDRVGPIGTGTIEMRSRPLSARLSGKLDEYHTTDNQMNRRVRRLFEPESNPHIEARGVALSATVESRTATHRVLLGSTNTEDLIFFDAYGFEIPADRHVDFFGGAGTAGIGGFEIRYRGSYLAQKLGPRPNTEGVDLDFRKRLVSGGIETRARSGPISMTGGGSIDITDASTTYTLDDTRILVTQIFGEVVGMIGNRLEVAVYGSWIQADGRPAFALHHSSDVTIAGAHWAQLTATLARRTISMDETLWQWTQRGYALPRPPLSKEPAASNIEELSSDPAPRLGTLDLEFGGRLTDELDYRVSGYFRRSLSDYHSQHEIAFDEASTGFHANTRLLGGVSGSFMGVSGSIDLRLNRQLSQRLTYVTEGFTSGDEALRHIHARIPSHRFAYSLTYSPVDRFSLYARARHHTHSRWRDYDEVAAASDGFYPSDLPSATLIDFAATKRLWKDHLIANIALRNVLNDTYRGHPAGAVFDMTFHFSVRASFSSQAGI